MQTLQRGISLIYWGIIVLVLDLIVLIVGLMTLRVKVRDWREAPAFFVFLLATFLIGWFMTFVGRLMCLAVPPEVGAAGLVYTSVFLDIVSVLVLLSQTVIDLPEMMGPLLQLSGVVSNVLFMLFLRQLATYVQRQDLAARARNVLIVGAIVVVLGIVLVLTAQVPAIAVAAGFSLMVLVIVAFVMGVNLLGALKDVLKDVHAVVVGADGDSQCWRCGEALTSAQGNCPVCGAWTG